MVIDSGNLNNLNARNKLAGGPVDKGSPNTGSPDNTSSSAPSGGKEQVQLSREAQSLNRLESKIASSPDVDMDKVAAIKTAISEGRFAINAERIAESLLRQDELLG